MNTEDFKKYGKLMIDFICEYASNVEKQDVVPLLDPGFLNKLIPDKPPVEGEKFEDLLQDVKEKIMPGVVHWNHPKFFAYFSSGNSYPSMLGDMISSGLGTIACSWATCPAATELETIVLDWFAKALGLPKAFISDSPGSRGGGVLHSSASECILVCMIAARSRAIRSLKGSDTECHDSVFLPQLVAYASKEAHSSVEKAAKISLVKITIIDSDAHGRFRVDLLRQAIQSDLNAGLKPFFVVATVGTTGACAFDNLIEIGKVCKDVPGIWFHVDGAYGGNSFILPEMRKFARGLEYADSFNTNPSKQLLVNNDASAMWVRDVMLLKSAFYINPLYLKHEHERAIDYRHYGIALSRRFRALKLWFVFRTYGVSGLQAHIRNHIMLAKKFEKLVREDDLFEVRNDVHLGLVCFRLKAEDHINQELLAKINRSGKMHMIPSMVNGKFVIRFCVTYEHATEQHILEAWSQIKAFATNIMRKNSSSRRSISKEMFESQSEHLTDGLTPIYVQSFLKVIDGTNTIKEISDVDAVETNNKCYD